MTVAPGLRIRVWVTDVWDIVTLDVSPDWTVGRLKQEALRRATGRDVNPVRYEVKFRGAPVLDESHTLAALGTPHNASFIVLRKGRPPVR